MDPTPPTRRLRLVLNLEADDLRELAAALHMLGNDLEFDGNEDREVTSGGYSSGYHLTLTCDPQMDGNRYRAALDQWVTDRRAAASVEGGESHE